MGVYLANKISSRDSFALNFLNFCANIGNSLKDHIPLGHDANNVEVLFLEKEFVRKIICKCIGNFSSQTGFHRICRWELTTFLGGQTLTHR